MSVLMLVSDCVCMRERERETSQRRKERLGGANEPNLTLHVFSFSFLIIGIGIWEHFICLRETIYHLWCSYLQFPLNLKKKKNDETKGRYATMPHKSTVLPYRSGVPALFRFNFVAFRHNT
jgi:hypothetical protein